MTQAAAGRRVGILGGTFDPIHVGHVATALGARHALRLDPVVVMPARVPPHRGQGPSASTFHRFAMAALAVNDLPGVMVSDEELCSDGPSYTALTLERLAARGLSPTEIYFITGADAFAEIETWHRYPAVLDLANFVVVSRPGVPVGTIADRLPQLQARLRPAGDADTPAAPGIHLVDVETPDVSSTGIRRRLRDGLPITGLVPEPVASYIGRQGLYGELSTADHLR